MSAHRALPRSIAVVNAAGASACDARAIAAGIPSRALMQRAGAAAAALIAEHFGDRLADGVVIATGGGNNGGDGWVIAHALHAAGIAVRVVECSPPGTPDAAAERENAIAAGVEHSVELRSLLDGGHRIVADALLGTGFDAQSPLRPAVASALEMLATLRARGASIVAVDLPSGVDASTGADAGCVPADLTVTFGTIKRGHLVARGECGRILVVDIGLGAHALHAGDATLVTEPWFRATLPPIVAASHKGTRGKVAIVGGAHGMAGAVLLAAGAALRSGAGLVKCVVAPESVAVVQGAEPSALCAAWPRSRAEVERDIGRWADVVLIGPGLGREGAREMVEQVLRGFAGPVVLDADALNAFEGDATALRALIGERPALLTPHPLEFARLADMDVASVLAARFDAPLDLARRIGATVLLKGVPTVIGGPDGTVRVVAEGTPILATGGSGDMLGGIAAVLMAETHEAGVSGALAAFAHGRAAAAVSQHAVRGFTLHDVAALLRGVWTTEVVPMRPPMLVDLPAVGERR